MLKKNHLLCLVLIIFCACLVGCAPKQDEQNNAGEVYTAENYKFTITFPKSWAERYIIEEYNPHGIMLISKKNCSKANTQKNYR